MSTKVYGMFQFSKKSKVQAIRHVITPSVSLGYRPDFLIPNSVFIGQFNPIPLVKQPGIQFLRKVFMGDQVEANRG